MRQGRWVPVSSLPHCVLPRIESKRQNWTTSATLKAWKAQTGQVVSATPIWKNYKGPSITIPSFFTTFLDFQCGHSNVSQNPSASLGSSFPEKNVMQSNTLKGVRELLCYLTLGLCHRKEKPGEDNGGPQLNEFSVTGLKHGYGKYEVVFEGAPSNHITAYFTLFWQKSLGPQLATSSFQN